MGRTRHELEVARRDRDLRRALGVQIRQPREDAGVSQAALARAARLDPAHVCRIEAGKATASLDAYQAIAVALGAELQLRLVPGAACPSATATRHGSPKRSCAWPTGASAGSPRLWCFGRSAASWIWSSMTRTNP